MRKKFLKSSLCLILTLSMTACGISTDDTKEQVATSEESVLTDFLSGNNKSDNVTSNLSLSAIASGEISTFDFLKANYASISPKSSNNMNTPIYDVAIDATFEFDCSENAGRRASRAFGVYETLNLDDSLYAGLNLADVEYDEVVGKLIIKPYQAKVFDDKGANFISNNTWGSYTQLYLAQHLDLVTGEELSTPIVTPFTIRHDLASPVLQQSIDTKNNYMLKWEPVPNASYYNIYKVWGDDINMYSFEYTTTDNFALANEFDSQKESEMWEDLVNQDLKNWGYEVQEEGVKQMNSAVKAIVENDTYFAIVAFDSEGNQSGVSNLIDSSELAGRLPSRIVNAVEKVTISSMYDVPTYVDVETVDGSIMQMVINYHGAQMLRYEDNPNKVGIWARVANTNFSPFLMVLEGMNYEEFKSNTSIITERQDSILGTTGGVTQVEIPIKPSTDSEDIGIELELEEPEVSTETTEIPDESAMEEVPISEESSTPELVSPSGDTPSTEQLAPSEVDQLFTEVSDMVMTNISLLGYDDIETVLHAESELEAWMVLCMLAQSPVIPVHPSHFPEASDMDYVFTLLSQAVWQNPCIGMVKGAGYNTTYNAIVMEYVEEPELRLNKTVEELAKAKELASSLTNDSMSDYDKIFAINEYLRTNASYDTSSAETDPSKIVYTTEFIDAHTPYGILMNNYGVCESYSEAFALIGRFAGLDVKCETGLLYGGGHEWNRVNVNGSWVMLDVTNNDIDYFENALFNVIDSDVSSFLIPDGVSYVNTDTIVATNTDYEYYRVNDLYADSNLDAKEILISQLASNNYGVVKLASTFNEQDALDILKLTAEELGRDLSGGFNLGVLYCEK